MSTIIRYDTSTGSDANGGGGGTIVSGTNGDITGTTLTLNETRDFTGNASGNPVYYTGNSGDRHLFTIASFTGGISTCTAIVVNETATATRTASNWGVGGKRQTLDNDTGNADFQDDGGGWEFELETGAYAVNTASLPITFPLKGTVALGGVRVVAASGASPEITWTADANLWAFAAGADVDFIGLSMKNTTSTSLGADLWDWTAWSSVRLIDCTVQCYGDSASVGDGHLVVAGCDMYSTNTYCIAIINTRSSVHIHNSVIKSGTARGISLGGSIQQQGSLSIIGNTIHECGGDGIYLAGTSKHYQIVVQNNVIHGNAGNGINIGGTHNVDFGPLVIRNNAITNNSGHGITSSTTDATAMQNIIENYNAFYSNTGDEVNNLTQGANDITLTADPYTDEAGDDYTMNSDSGGGADCKDTGDGLG